jgi:hypothetical protein
VIVTVIVTIGFIDSNMAIAAAANAAGWPEKVLEFLLQPKKEKITAFGDRCK